MYRLNISALARASGVTRQHITNVLAGDTIPSMLVAERIDKAIDAEVATRKQTLLDSVLDLAAMSKKEDQNAGI